MQCAGKANFRVGGTSGGWKLLFGERAELGEECFLSMFTYAQSAAKSSCLQMKKPDSAYYYMLKGHHARTPDLVGKTKKLNASPMHWENKQ